MRSLILISLLVALPALARADEFTKFVASLPESGAAMTGGHLASCKTLVTPDGRIRHQGSLSRKDLVGATAVTLAVTSNKTEAIPSSQYSWRYATVEARAGKKVVATFGVVEVFGAMGNPDAPFPDAPIAAMWSRLITDHEAAKAKLSPPAIADYAQPRPKNSDDDQNESDAQEVRDSVALAVRADHFLAGKPIVIGSGPGEVKVDPRRWTITLTRDGGIDVTGEGWLGVAVTHFIGKPKSGPPIAYTAMAVETMHLTGGGSPVAELSLVAFGVPQPTL